MASYSVEIIINKIRIKIRSYNTKYCENRNEKGKDNFNLFLLIFLRSTHEKVCGNKENQKKGDYGTYFSCKSIISRFKEKIIKIVK